MNFISYAQNFEDVILWRALADVQQGRYVDVGAHDPIVDSVSFAFYQAGWRGLHVEPIPAYAAKLREARPEETVVEAAVTDVPGPIPFFELSGLSSGRRDIADHHSKFGHNAREMIVPTVRLDDLLRTIGPDVHWLKIDVEGMEGDVLRSWGDSPARPWVLVVESTFPNSQVSTEHLWIDHVLDRNYREVFFDGLSRYFLHESQADRSDAFDRPANVFDQFAVTRHHFAGSMLRSELENSERRVAELHAGISDLRGRLEASDQRVNETVNLLEGARSAQAEALQRVVATEHEHRQTVETLFLARQSAEHELRRSFAAREAELSDRLRDAESDVAAVRIELARFEERSIQLQKLIDRAEQLRHAQEQAARDDLAKKNQRLEAVLARADSLIQGAAAAQPGRWHRIGERLGLARTPPSLRLLATWSMPLDDSLEASTLDHQSSCGEAESIMQSSALTQARNPYMRANTLSELLAWEGRDFVRCAYVTVLGRQPDREGERYYIERMRHGYSKMEVLWQLRRSPEAARHDPGIAGFDRALRNARLRSWPFRTFRSIGGTRAVPTSSHTCNLQSEASTAAASTANLPAHEKARAGLGPDESFAAEIQSLRAIIDGFGHALRGVADAQVRHELEFRALRSSTDGPKVASVPRPSK